MLDKANSEMIRKMNKNRNKQPFNLTFNGRAVTSTSDNVRNNGFMTTAPDQTKEIATLCDKIESIEMEDDIRITDESSAVRLEDSEFLNDNVMGMQDRDGDTPLHTGIILQVIPFVLLCIRSVTSPVTLSIKNKLSQTPLHLAALTNNVRVARRLVVGGADVESRDRFGNTPLHIACREGYYKIVDALLKPVQHFETKQNNYEIPYQKIPQNLEICNYEGQDCLHLAAFRGYIEIVEILIDKGADVNSKDRKTGRTILHTACLNGNDEIVKHLLKHSSCNLNARAYDGYTPFDLALVGGNKRIQMELAVAGAQYGESDDELAVDGAQYGESDDDIGQ